MMKAIVLNVFITCFIVQAANANVLTLPQTKIIKEGKYTLTFINYAATLDPAWQQKMIKTFFIVYPELAKTYNKKTAKQVTFVIDTTYKGVAGTDSGRLPLARIGYTSTPKILM